MDTNPPSAMSEATDQQAVLAAHVGIEDAATFKFGLPSDPDDAMQERFARYCIKLYKKMEWSKSTLSEYFAEDFGSYSATTFANISASSHPELRDVPRARRVYVQKGRNIWISDALAAVVKEEGEIRGK